MATVGKWNLGFGSNMNVKHITEKKGVKILGKKRIIKARTWSQVFKHSFLTDHTAAILKGFRLDFMPGGQGGN